MNQNTAQPAQDQAIVISGPTFFNVCSYIGSKPINQVLALRKALWQIQAEQNCTSAQTLPEQVWLSVPAVNAVQAFLSTCPCDEVIDLLTKFEQEITQYVSMMEEQRKQQAAASALAEVQAEARPADEDQAATQTDAQLVDEQPAAVEQAALIVVEKADTSGDDGAALSVEQIADFNQRVSASEELGAERSLDGSGRHLDDTQAKDVQSVSF